MPKFLKELIKENTVVFLETTEMQDTIIKMVEIAKQENFIKDKEKFRLAILDRENLVSTGIGLGVAIPHAKLDDVDDFFIIVGINKKGLDWDAIDRNPVGIVFLIGGPDKEGAQREYLKIIAKLMLLIKNDIRRNFLINASQKEQVVDIFKEF